MAKTILAVDDSTSIRQMVAFTLKSAGYTVIEAADGVEGLAKANANGQRHYIGADRPEHAQHGWLDFDQNSARSAAIRSYADFDVDH